MASVTPTAETQLRPADTVAYVTDHILSNDQLRVNIPVVYEYGPGWDSKRGLMTRERATHLADHVLDSFKDAPEGTFTANPELPTYYPEANHWVQSVVTDYLSQHTAESIAQPVPPLHPGKEYVFPEEFQDKLLDVHTVGAGYFFKSVQGTNGTQILDPGDTDMVSRTLDGRHTCDEMSMVYDNLAADFNPTTGETVLRLSPDIQLCNDSTMSLAPALQESYRAHMTAYLNSDDPVLSAKLGLLQYLHRGELTTTLATMSQAAGNEWLDSLGMTCEQIIAHGRGPTTTFVIDSKHIDKPDTVGADLMKGPNLVVASTDAGTERARTIKKSISRHISSSLRNMVESRPDSRTPAQWAMTLTETAQRLKRSIIEQTNAELGRLRRE